MIDFEEENDWKIYLDEEESGWMVVGLQEEETGWIMICNEWLIYWIGVIQW